MGPYTVRSELTKFELVWKAKKAILFGGGGLGLEMGALYGMVTNASWIMFTWAPIL